MSRLSELKAGLCPDGVEYKKIGDVCTIHARIGWQRLTKKEYQTSGDYLLITGTDFTETHEVNYSTCVYVSEDRYLQDEKLQLRNGDILITKDATIGKVAQVQNLPKPATLNSHIFVVRCKDNSLNHRFMLYYLTSEHFMNVVAKRKTTGIFASLPQYIFSQILIPVPPLEVQAEIVRILDKFTSLTAELTAELTLRKQQYSYYRDKLLTFGDETPRVTLGEVIHSLRTGLNPRKFFKLNTEDAHNYYITIREMHNGKIMPTDKTDRINDEAMRLCNKRSNLEAGDVLFSGTGTIGETVVIEETPTNWNIKEGIFAIKPKQDRIQPHFLRHILNSSSIKNAYMDKAVYGTMHSITMKDMLTLQIPVPPIEQQIRIAQILDRFDSLCNDLTHGLPAEISARRKQYEYYRDKLLTFTPKEKN